jgi:hypothetical protein
MTLYEIDTFKQAVKKYLICTAAGIVLGSALTYYGCVRTQGPSTQNVYKYQKVSYP